MSLYAYFYVFNALREQKTTTLVRSFFFFFFFFVRSESKTPINEVTAKKVLVTYKSNVT